MADLERLAQKVREEPRSIAFVAYADGLRREGREAEAWEVLREGMRYHPDLSSARLVAARLHVWEGRGVLAADILAEVVQHDPANDAARVLLARLLLQQGRVADARAHATALEMSGVNESIGVMPHLPPFEPPPAAPDPFESPWLAARLLAAGDYARAIGVWERIAAVTDAPGARERLAEVRRAAAGQGIAWIEAMETRPGRALPARRELEVALAEEAAERPPASARVSLATAFWAHAESVG